MIGLLPDRCSQRAPAAPGGRLRPVAEREVRARLELKGRGVLRRPTAGIDVRGDGTFMPYRGGVGREELDPSSHDTPFDLVRETLEGEGR